MKIINHEFLLGKMSARAGQQNLDLSTNPSFGENDPMSANKGGFRNDKILVKREVDM